MNVLKTLAVSTLSLLSLIACKSLPSYSADYDKANKEISGIILNDEQALLIGQRFVAAFNTMGTVDFVKNTGQLYADHLYINDTLSQFSSKKELVKHFEGMNEHISNVSVKLISTTHTQDSAYIHWHMVYDFKMLGRRKTMSSYGISQIKINDKGLIVFQQDYWDPANGLYRSLPYVGKGYSLLLPFKI
ncbi:nuclear transport factor 2 family protein [Acinetobacter colistiniresistens]|uniref:Nuclear transport factor 2 family protein n=1 Tax=Acinetobacter colistiniresistens TaxID=280145 RepID=A0A558EWZ5_9GAMM|nr:nuclear transport factor 2 family protein [Acinetobacter colistiniresistens]TVT77678.1 nuclear transport factor 2 family protein [Acinetobacter colistiniresistens]